MALDRGAGDRRALVGRARGVAQDHLDLVGRKVKLLGSDLAIGRRDAGAQVDMADQRDRRGPAAASVVQREQDLQPFGRIGPDDGRLARGRRRRHRWLAQHQQRIGRGAEIGAAAPDAGRRDHSAGSGAGDDSAIHCAASCTAARISRWLPQRHRLCDSADLACASVGRGWRRSSATVAMIMPLRQ